MTSGIVFCLATSFLWALSSIFATNAVRVLGPQTYNCLRLVLGSSLLWLIFFVSHPWKMPDAHEWLLIATSAAIGLAFGDMFLFKGFEILGARRSTLVFMLNIPITTLISFFLLNETLSQQELLGGTVAVTGIALATYAGKNDKGGRTKVDVIEGSLSKGLMFCFVAACCQSVGLLTLKPVLNHGEFSPVQIAALRFTVAGIVSLLLAYQTGSLKSLRFKAEIGAIYSALFAIVTGGVIGFIFYITGISRVPSAYAALLTSLSPLFVLPILAVYNRKSPSLMAWFGAMLGMGGVFLCLYH